jgi:excisionase family DNA binding protein
MTSDEKSVALLQDLVDLMKARHPANEVMGADEAATYLDVSKSFFWELVHLHKIPYAPLKGAKSRGRVVFRKQDLDAFLAAQLVRGPQDAMKLNDARRHRRAA